ncbi:hypothetical protein SAMN05216327_12050 [Dyadobacter sp. SG02]|uniref:hypothetical protein n=1 Tax=Dyadobacter sp. SG02 TaxID=1855291 RepID=UPI0008CA1679|nr:hypothetical protein [Dyadobacter sp. SG02]SEJ79371.1 hypothetical protein SAMN05216327_12050 [Dyadobacter sp. SG02]
MKKYFFALCSCVLFAATNRESSYETMKFIYHYSLFNGKWAGSPLQKENVIFMSEIYPYTCTYVTDCAKKERQAKDYFILQLNGQSGPNPHVTPEKFTDRREAEKTRKMRRDFYERRLRYRVYNL